VRQENDFLYCTEPASCRKAVIGTIAHFCKVVDIQGFGDKILAEAYDAEVLRSPADLFALTAAELLPLERVGDELARKLVANVAAHRRIELPTFLRALGVDALGQHVAGILAERFGTLAAIRHVTGPELAAIHSIGPTIATSVVSGLATKAPLIDALLAQVAVAEAGAERTAGPLAGQSFVFTGKLLAFERAVAQKKVISLGGAAPSGVTKTLTYLVVGDGKEESKSSKQLKAEKYIAEGAALRVITEREFLALVGEI
jgi:DNA ligase (NAD+)